MITIFASMGQGQTYWTQTSIATLLDNLLKYHSIEIKRSWIFACLAGLKAQGYIKTHLRYRHDSAGWITQIPSIIIFRLKGIVWLLKMGISKARILYKSMTTWLKKPDARWPHQTDFDDGSYMPKDPQEKEALKNLLGPLTTRIT